MHDVVINGTHYVPASEQHARIGVAITTHERPEALARALAQHEAHRPPGSITLVIDDASSSPVADAAYRFEQSVGIVGAKNKSLELLMRAGVEHLFLFDDDAWPIADDWWRPYVDSPEPHLSYQFLDLAGPRKLKDVAETYRDDEHVAYTGQRGVMLYFHRSAIEAVGGFDPVYGRGTYEHSDLALRIHHAGLTTWPYADVVGSEKLVHSLDEHEAIERTLTTATRTALVRRNAGIHNDRRRAGHTGYVDYHEPRDVVLTCLYGARPDPQRPGRTVNTSQLGKLIKSVHGGDVVVFSDQAGEIPGAQVEHSTLANMSVFHRRWLDYYRWLRAHPETRWVFAVDGTDVQMLREPWSQMRAERLYVGYEPEIVGCEWMRAKHKTHDLVSFIDSDPGRLLLNAGVVGGDRATMLTFCHAMTRAYFENAARRFWREEKHDIGTDMGTLNQIAYTRFAEQIETGPRVTSLFKRGENAQQSPAWWAHK